MANTETEFWSNPDEWPLDAFGYVFLGNAVDQVGTALFGDNWSTQDVNKRDEAAGKLHSWFLDKGLNTALRDTGGGAIGDPLPAHVWHNEHWQNYFKLCEMDHAPGKRILLNSQYLFVEEVGLSDLISDLAEPEDAKPSNIPDDVYLTMELKLAFDVIRHFGITEDNCPSIPDTKTWLRKTRLQELDIELADRRLELIAKIVRPPLFQGSTPPKYDPAQKK